VHLIKHYGDFNTNKDNNNKIIIIIMTRNIVSFCGPSESFRGIWLCGIVGKYPGVTGMYYLHFWSRIVDSAERVVFFYPGHRHGGTCVPSNIRSQIYYLSRLEEL